MNLTETSLRNPAGVLVAILMVALLGIFALVKLPIQLFPNIEEPVISIFTSWRAAAPTEIESEIIEPQERALRACGACSRSTPLRTLAARSSTCNSPSAPTCRPRCSKSSAA